MNGWRGEDQLFKRLCSEPLKTGSGAKMNRFAQHTVIQLLVRWKYIHIFVCLVLAKI